MAKHTNKKRPAIKFYRKNAIKQARLEKMDSVGNCKSQGIIVEKINQLFEKFYIDYTIDQKRFSQAETGITQLNLPEGLALASVLDGFMSDLIEEKFLQLGSFDIKLASYNNTSQQEQELLCNENHDRICIFSTFPSYIYLDMDEFDNNAKELNQKRFEQFYNGKSTTQEFYLIDGLLNYIFSPISRYSTPQKIQSLTRILDMFDKNLDHSLHFFYYDYVNFASIELIKALNVIYLSIPLSNSFLKIKHPLIFDKIKRAFHNPTNVITNNESSVELIKQLKKLLETYPYPTIEHLKKIYNSSSNEIQQVMFQSIKYHICS